jgi:predicted  nucleic acid-binding Zn-ribbon protein
MSFRTKRSIFAGSGRRADEDVGLAAVAGPGQLYNDPQRGRTDKRKSEKGGRDASRSRSRSSSVLRKLMGKKDKPKTIDVKPSYAASSSSGSVSGFGDECSVVSASTTGTGGFKKDRPKVKKISKKTGEDRAEASSRSRRTFDDRYDFRGFGDEETPLPSASPRSTPKIKKIKKKSKIVYNTHKDGMDSDGDIGMDSDGDGGVSMDGRSVNSDGVLSPGAIRKLRRKKKPKKDDDTCGSSKSSLNGDRSVDKRRSSSSRPTTKVAAIVEPPMSPAGKILLNEMDDLYPSPKSTEKKKSPSRSRSKPHISVISFQKEEVEPRKRDDNNCSDSFQKVKSSWETQQAVAVPNLGTDTNSHKMRRPPLPVTPPHEVDVAADSGTWRKTADDSGLSTDALPQPTSTRSYRSRGGDNDTVMSLTETVASLNKQLEDQREDGKQVQKLLADALAKISTLNESVRREEAGARKANAYLAEVREELGKIMDEKADLARTVNNLEDDLRAKDERIEKLQQVVETQLDTVEFLEDKLEKTEDELFKMEDEFRAMEEEGLLNQSAHSTSHLGRAGRMDSIRGDRVKRTHSIQMEKQESRRLLQEDEGTDHTRSDHVGKRLRSSSAENDIEERERKVVAREKELVLQREEFDLREQRLEEWEQELLDLDEQLKNGNDTNTKEKLLERRESKLEEIREELELKKVEWTEKIRKLEEQNRTLLSSQSSSTEKDHEIKALQSAIDKLDDEKAELESSLERVTRMKDDTVQKLKKLESDNEELREKLGAARSTSIKDEQERQKEIRQLQAEITALQKSGSCSAEQEDVVRQMQDEIAEQLHELDDENQKLNEKLLSETKRFEAQLELKDETIMDLERTMEGLKENLESQDSGSYIASLLKELSDLKKNNRVLSSMDSELNDALACLEEKDAAIKALEEKLTKVGQTQSTGSQSQEEDGRDLLIRELQNQLVAAKKDFQTVSSGDYITRLKLEIKNLKTGYNDLKKRLKKEENEARVLLKKKDDVIQSMQKEMAAQKRELERREKREKNLGTDQKLADGDLQKHIEDLEDEIDHWKATNADLEDELDNLKVEVSELKTKAEGEDFDDDCSLGSIQSFTSQMSEQQGMEKSNHSVTSLRSNDLFFVSNSNSMRGHRSIPGAPPTGDEPSTPSQRALRTVSDLWSKMRSGPEPTAQSNPAIPYGIGSLDDD